MSELNRNDYDFEKAIIESIDFVLDKNNNSYHPCAILPDGIEFIENVETQEIGFLHINEIETIMVKPVFIRTTQALEKKVKELEADAKKLNQYILINKRTKKCQ